MAIQKAESGPTGGRVANPHTFHIPVMGTGFTVDTPLRVARFGISSVMAIGDDGAGLPGAGEITGKGLVEYFIGQARGESPGLGTSHIVEGHVSRALEAVVGVPVRLAVPY